MSQHTWVALIPFDLDDTQVRIASSSDKTRLVLRPDMVRWKDVPPPGCFVCEQTYKDAKDTPCPGEPTGYGPHGTPIYGKE